MVASYWMFIRPADPARLGFAEDFCPGVVRQMMAENITEHGKPDFFTRSFMAPQGAMVPYMSWTIERDWIGAHLYAWDKEFPFFWVYIGVSFLISYLGVGAICRKMGLGSWAAWLLSGLLVVFHVPRHYKTYHHFEHIPLHWLYLSVFLDAWIWQTAVQKKKWALHLEAWRAFCLLGMLSATGYYWGPLILEWLIVRGFLLARRKQLKIEAKRVQIIAAGALSVAVAALFARWFLPLKQAAGSGEVKNGLGWFATPGMVLRPIWLYWVLKPLQAIFPRAIKPSPIDLPETVVTIGWLYWIPVVAAIRLAWKQRAKSPHGMLLAPFLTFGAFLILYIFHIGNEFFQLWVPFLGFFRVATRTGLLMPVVFGAVIALSWPQLVALVQKAWSKGGRKIQVALVLFAAQSVAEFFVLGVVPINSMERAPPELVQLLEQVRQMPGDTVLDLPFCVAGGNGVCTDQMCPHYPHSTIGHCLRQWHEKRVYGLYQARMSPAHCSLYDSQPYLSWFAAWKQNRCLTGGEWKDFCGYLEGHSETSAVLFYPEIWKAAAQPACRTEMESHLGKPLSVAHFNVATTRYGPSLGAASVEAYRARCLAGRSKSK